MTENKKAFTNQFKFAAWMEVGIIALCVLQFIFGK